MGSDGLRDGVWLFFLIFENLEKICKKVLSIAAGTIDIKGAAQQYEYH